MEVIFILVEMPKAIEFLNLTDCYFQMISLEKNIFFYIKKTKLLLL